MILFDKNKQEDINTNLWARYLIVKWRLLDGCAGAASKHIAEELVIGILNCLMDFGIDLEDRRFPAFRF